jgi:hypothetical protein
VTSARLERLIAIGVDDRRAIPANSRRSNEQNFTSLPNQNGTKGHAARCLGVGSLRDAGKIRFIAQRARDGEEFLALLKRRTGSGMIVLEIARRILQVFLD